MSALKWALSSDSARAGLRVSPAAAPGQLKVTGEQPTCFGRWSTWQAELAARGEQAAGLRGEA